MPNTPKGLPYPTPADPVSSGANDIKALAEAVDMRLGITGVGVAWPTAPVDGQRYIWAVAAGIAWEFVYIGGWGWCYVGGPPLVSEVSAVDFTGSDVYTSTGTQGSSGPSLTLPFVGTFDIHFGAYLYGDFPDVYSSMAIKFGGFAAGDIDSVTSNGGQASVSRIRRVALAAGQETLVAQYKKYGGGSAFFSNRWMAAMPVKV